MEDLFTVKEAAEKVRVSEGWWRQRIAQKRVKVVHLGGRVMIPASTINEIVESGTIEPIKKL